MSEGSTKSAIRIEGTCEGATLDKRFYMPGIVIKYDCPKCGHENCRDLGEEYIKQYARVGKPMMVSAYCGKCENEWDVGEVVIRLTLEAVS